MKLSFPFRNRKLKVLNLIAWIDFTISSLGVIILTVISIYQYPFTFRIAREVFGITISSNQGWVVILVYLAYLIWVLIYMYGFLTTSSKNKVVVPSIIHTLTILLVSLLFFGIQKYILIRQAKLLALGQLTFYIYFMNIIVFRLDAYRYGTLIESGLALFGVPAGLFGLIFMRWLFEAKVLGASGEVMSTEQSMFIIRGLLTNDNMIVIDELSKMTGYSATFWNAKFYELIGREQLKGSIENGIFRINKGDIDLAIDLLIQSFGEGMGKVE